MYYRFYLAYKRLMATLITFIICGISCDANASVSIGKASQNILEPLSGLNALIFKACFILGTALLLGAVVQYRVHRNNPQEVRLHQPILMLIFGLTLIGAPWLVKISSGASILTGQTI